MATLGPLLEADENDLAILTKARQKILVELLHEPMSLATLNNEISDFSKSTISKSLEKLEENQLIEKDEKNKIYRLGPKGTDIALIIAEPNGYSEEDLTMKLRDRVADKVVEHSDMDRFEAEDKANQLARALRDLKDVIESKEESEKLTEY